jgi:hypothetical protein
MLKDGLSIAEVGHRHGKNESRTHSTALDTIHPEHTDFSSQLSLWNHRLADAKELPYGFSVGRLHFQKGFSRTLALLMVAF